MSRLADGRPSATAWGAAMHRARHQLLDDPIVFADPVALQIVGPDVVAAIRAEAPDPRPHRRAMRAFIAARSRFADDLIAASLAAGPVGIVVLGAGLDTTAYRSDSRAAVPVVEIDHPATQAWKRHILAERGIEVPATVRFVGVDFERASIEDGLARTGLDQGTAIVVVWLGVTPYLTRDAITATLRAVADWPGGARIVFDYGAVPDPGAAAIATPGQRRAVRAAFERVAGLGEPWITFFEPADLDGLVRAAGFADVEDLDGPAIDGRYFAGRTDGLRVGRLAHLVAAATRPEGSPAAG